MPRTLTTFAKSLLPKVVVREIRQYKARRLADKYAAMADSKTAFNEVYASNFWGEGNESRSGDGSGGNWLDFSIDYLRRHQSIDGKTVVEIGCGDFNFGKRVCSAAKSYTGVDVASIIVDDNRQRFADLHNVSFACADAAAENISPADVYIIRQVLQHLPNDHVRRIIGKLLAMQPSDIIVFEHVPSDEFSPNTDLEFPGPFTRSIHHSGLDLRVPPFEFPFELTEEILHADHPREQSKLVCYHHRRPL